MKRVASHPVRRVAISRTNLHRGNNCLGATRPPAKLSAIDANEARVPLSAKVKSVDGAQRCTKANLVKPQDQLPMANQFNVRTVMLSACPPRQFQPAQLVKARLPIAASPSPPPVPTLRQGNHSQPPTREFRRNDAKPSRPSLPAPRTPFHHIAAPSRHQPDNIITPTRTPVTLAALRSYAREQVLKIYDEQFLTRERAEALRHAEQLQRSIIKYGQLAALDAARLYPRIGHPIAYDFPYLNPWARLPLVRALLRDLAFVFASRVPMYAVTLIDWRFDTTDKTWHFNRERIRRRIETALSGCHYVGMIEFAFLMNYRIMPHGGHLICPHFQGIFWGRDSLARIEQIQRTGWFAGGRFGAAGVRKAPLPDMRDFIKVLTYSIKAPSYGYQHNPHLTHPFGNATRLYLPQHFCLLRMLGHYSFWDLMLPGGQGAEVVRNIRRRLKRQAYERRERLGNIRHLAQQAS